MFNVIGKGITIKDPELKYTKNGSAVASCTAVNKEEYKGEETPHFTNLVLFGDVAEKFAKEITKGCLIEIKSAILKHPVYKDKDGKNHYNTEVVVFEYDLIQKFESKKK